VSNRDVTAVTFSRVGMSIVISAVMSFNRSAPVTANYRRGVQAIRCCSDGLQSRDHHLIETAMVSQGAIL